PLLRCEAFVDGNVPARETDMRLYALPPTARIVGGIDAPPGAWPWASAIALTRSDGSLFQYCGGSLIAADWVLTAAHCEVEAGDKIILGRTNLTASGGEQLDVEFVLTHIDYNDSTNDNDIALVKLQTPSSQTPLQLIDSTEMDAQPGDLATIIGWGLLSEAGQPSPTALQQVEVPIQTTPQCQLEYSTTITANMVCAGTNQGGMDSCQGDSGGPLMVRSNAQAPWQQAGVVSFGIGCARPGVFGVYARVGRYRDWIAACQASPAQ
ncbi:MAG: serine protease, partial [Gammaproteobacteria bacterium]|nr:serine protease [Gammaproteobacteria bacterium]